MNHQDIEQELRHLEYVFSHILATDKVPTLQYWRGRLNALRKAAAVPPHRDKMNRLEQVLRALELSKREDAPSNEEDEFSTAADFGLR
ncbi:hypothetical protein [Paraburkholderia sp.]|jgi:hypothetical protein|uniref:hypothetical protein n=1 Tax=Paraburkholderia sp. TaxID=1926495 RepID=UPI002F3FA0DC